MPLERASTTAIATPPMAAIVLTQKLQSRVQAFRDQFGETAAVLGTLDQ